MTILIRLRDAVKDILRKADMLLLALCLIAAFYGILLIASATNYREESFQLRRIIVQTAGTILGGRISSSPISILSILRRNGPCS